MLRVLRVLRVQHRAYALPLEERRHFVRVLQKLPPETKGEEAKQGPKEAAEGAAEGAKAGEEVSARGDGGLAGEQVRVVVPLPFARHARMVLLSLRNPRGVRCAFCACYALQVSRFKPSSGGQHPVFRVLQTPVRVKEEPSDSPERCAEPEGAQDTETAAEGKMTDGDITEL